MGLGLGSSSLSCSSLKVESSLSRRAKSIYLFLESNLSRRAENI
jgi:hypothetical protein